MGTVTAAHLEILKARGLDEELVVRLGVESLPSTGGDQWIRIPYVIDGEIVNWKNRTIGGPKIFWQGERDESGRAASGKKCFWNLDCLSDPALSDQPLIITEGEFDAMAAIQAGFLRTVSVPDGAPAVAKGEDDNGVKYTYLDDAEKLLRDVREIIICADSDEPGGNLFSDLVIRLGKPRCKFVRYPQGCKDLNDALQKYGPKGVTETIRRAQWVKVSGVYRMSELPPVATRRPHDTGFPLLGRHYNLRLGDWVVVTGIPGHGKSTFLTDLACRVLNLHGWNTAFASFEQSPQADHKRNLRRWFLRKPEDKQSEAEQAAADQWIDRNFSFIVPDEDDDVSLGWVLERCAASIIQHGVKIVVIDPWNEMDHVRGPDMSLTEYTGFAIKQFRKLARKYDVHVIVAAHPVKQRKEADGTYEVPSLYDISDSAHWYNKADVGIIVHRASKAETLIRVAKSRYHDQIGEPGEVIANFNPYQGRFEIFEANQPGQSTE